MSIAFTSFIKAFVFFIALPLDTLIQSKEKKDIQFSGQNRKQSADISQNLFG